MLANQGPDIYRMKGVLSFRDAEERYVFQGVHMLMDAAPMVSAATENVYVFLVTLAKIAPMHLHARKIHVKMVYVHKDVVSVMMDGLAKHVH